LVNCHLQTRRPPDAPYRRTPSSWISCRSGLSCGAFGIVLRRLMRDRSPPGLPGINLLGGSPNASFECDGGRFWRRADDELGHFRASPADPNNPNEAVPDAMTLTPYGETINIETAKKAAAGAIAEAVKRNWNGFCVAVVR